MLQASALALRKVPEVNASWFPEFIRQYHSVDCSVAVQVGLLSRAVTAKDSQATSSVQLAERTPLPASPLCL
jgi:pyruvate dehydrogenase E2 component (dihydrolipoamide acetyltransferase)